MYKQEVFKKHANGVILTVKTAVDLLEKGDTDTLVKTLKELGAMHLSHGLKLKKAHYEMVGQALVDTLATALGNDFTDEVKRAWLVVYATITEKMMQGAAQFEEETSPSLVVNSWSKIKDIESYDEVAGELLFKR
jgi:hemoglobin-like flavoprotein